MADEQAGPAHGTRAAAREFIAEQMGGLVAHARVVCIYADQGNDAGLLYAARCTAAYLRALLAGIEELERVRGVEAYRRSAGQTGPGSSS